jgi:predicted dehydrogenase
MSQPPPPRLTRRSFLIASAALATGISLKSNAAEPIAPQHASSNEMLNLGVVGCGGRGGDNLKEMAASSAPVNVIALCDVDQKRAAETFKKYPGAQRYTDWRKMLEAEKSLDCVLVATPDHNHAIVSIAAMRLGKHVYCEKPLAHSIWEARQMAKVATETGVATQMGTQGHAFDGTRSAVEIVRSGGIGEVRELHVWTDRPAGWWPQGVTRPTEAPPVPESLDWDIWLGPARHRPYNPAYLPFKWRGWWDFGTGAIGDMGVHNLDTAYWALELTIPTLVQVIDCSPAFDSASASETAPLWSIMELYFPARGEKPPVKMTWYDGGKLPPAELFHGEPVPSKDGGSLLIGSKGSLLTRTWHGGESKKDRFLLLPQKQFTDYQLPTPSLPRPKDHHHEWLAAARGQGKSFSNFPYAASLTESLLLGNLALRTGIKKIEWDARNMTAKGCPEADAFIRPEFRQGWRI